MLHTRRTRWPVATFIAHTVFIVLVYAVDRYFIFTLRNLQERVIDRPAYELWWWLQNTYPRPIGDLLFPLAKLLGLHLFSEFSWFVWCVVVGSLPYVAAAAILGRLAEIRDARRDGSNKPRPVSGT